MPLAKSVRHAVTAAVIATFAPFIATQSAAADVPSCDAAGIGIDSLGGPNFPTDGQKDQFHSSYTGYRVTNSTGTALSDTWVQLSDFTGDSLALAADQAAAEQIASLGDGSSRALFWYLTAAAQSNAAQGLTITVYDHNPALPGATAVCSKGDTFNQVLGTLEASANKVNGISVSNGGAPTLGSLFTITVTGNTGTIGDGPLDASDPQSLWMSPAVRDDWPASAFRLVSTELQISPDGNAADSTRADQLRFVDLGSKARDYTATYTFQAIGFTSGPTTVQPVQEIASGTQVKHTGSYSVSLPEIAPPTNTLALDLAASPDTLDEAGGDAAYTGTLSGTPGATVDTFTVTLPAGATYVPGSAGFAGSDIADPVLDGDQLVFTGPFTLPGASAPLTFTLTLPGTPGAQVTSLVAGLGAALIGTDPTDVSVAHPATATVYVGTPPPPPDNGGSPLEQTVTFTPPAQLLTGPAPYVLTAASSADLPVSFAVTDGTDVCAVSGSELTVTGTGTCTVEASAAGDGTYAAATPVTRTIDVVAPVDDTATLPATTGTLTPHDIAVLTNDPSGLALSWAGGAADGTVSAAGDHVTYTPDVRFRGVDQFDYQVTDDAGRTATAHVTVTVPNAAPTARDATLRQVAGTAAQVHVPASDLNGDPLSLTVARHPGNVAVAVSGTTVTVTPAAGVSGRITIAVVVHDGAGGRARAYITDRVRPQPVATAHRSISSAGTRITWPAAAAPNATYRVRVNGRLVCETRLLSCHVDRLLGPDAHVTVRVLGRDSTVSTPTLAAAVHGPKVLVATVYFASGQWTLDATQRAYLDRVAHRLRANGFRGVHLAGYTDSIGSPAYNLHLSHQRTETVAGILFRQTGLTSRQAWYGEKDPVVDAAAAARNRRVEILVS